MTAARKMVGYLAQQSGERVIIIATGEHAATAIEPHFQETPVAGSLPAYRLIHTRPRGRGLKFAAEFMAHTSFPANQQINRVVVYDEDGHHEIAVIQIMDMEYLSYLFVNKVSIPVQGTRTNSLTPDACKEFDLDSVDMHTSQSDFNEIELPIVKPDTYSLIYFVPGKVELTTPIQAATCIRLTDVGEGRTLVDAFVYNEREYTRQDHQFSLDGVLGCSAVANLGFCLLKSLHGITTRALSTVTITDRAWIDKYEQFDLKVADDPIFDFCKGNGVEKVLLGAAKRDCDNWTECKDIPGGVRCIHNKPDCK